MSIIFGVAGTSGLGYDGALVKCKELGLGSLEVAFTYGVRMTNVKAREIALFNKKTKIKLSVHAPYYINLASKDKVKLNASKRRILDSCERAHFLGASPVVFHAGFFQGRDESVVFDLIKDEIIDLQKSIKKNKWRVELAPEVTGKKSQFTGLDGLLELNKQTGCGFCVDFAHLFARNNGVIDFDEVFLKLKKFSHLHCHFSGINFGAKGERNHIPLNKAFFMNLAKSIKKNKPKSLNIVCESPDPFVDAKKMLGWF